jgi:hypothetical protein
VFNYLEKHKTYEKSVRGVKCVFNLCTAWFETIFCIYKYLRSYSQYMQKYMQVIAIVSDLNQNLNVFSNFSKLLKYRIS